MATPRVERREAEVQTISYGSLTWVNIEAPTLAEMEYLREHFSFDPLTLEDCLSKIQVPKIDEYPDYLFLVLHFPLTTPQGHIAGASQVSIFAGDGYVVTVHRGDLRPLVKLFRDCLVSEAVRAQVMAHSSGFLLYKVLDGLVDYCFPVLNTLLDRVERVEERLLEDRRQVQTIRDLSLLRRDVLTYRHMVRPQMPVMETLERKNYPFLRVEEGVYFGDLADHTRRLWMELEDLKEVVEGFYDTLFTLNTTTTNDALRVLTILATVALPAVVLGTLYGMNVLLPGGVETGPWTFLGPYTTLILAFLASIVPAGVMLWVFRRLGWL